MKMFLDKLSTLLCQALKRLERMPGYTLLSMLGLVISLSGTVIIARYLHQEWTIDHWMPDLDRTFLMTRRFTDANADSGLEYTFIGNPNNEKGYVSPVEGQSAVESWTNISLLWPTRVTLPGGESFFSTMAAIDSSLTEVFPYKTVAGTLVMHTEEECIVSEEFARRYFPDEDAVGQSLVLESEKLRTIVGIFRQPKTKSSFRFDVAQYRDEPWHISRAIRLGVVRLNKGYTAEDFNAQQPEITFTYEFQPKPFRYHLTPYLPFMKEHFVNYRISDGPCLVHQSQTKYLWMLFGVGILLFFVGVFNFLNLYAVMRHTREHEMKVRRIFGASRWNIFSMLYIENLLISTPAMLGVWMVIELTTPHMKDWFAIEQMAIPAFDIVLSLGIMFLLPLIATVGRRKRSTHGSASFLFLQYFISISLITVSIYLMRQLNLMMTSDPGYRTENLLSCRIFRERDDLRVFHSQEEWEEYHKKRDSENDMIMQRLRDCPYILGMTEDPYITSNGGSVTTADGVALEYRDMNETKRRMFGLEVLEGRMFCDSLDDWHTHYHCLLNETAVRRLGLKDWHGAKIQLQGRLWFGVDVDDNYNPPYEVVGILRDFHSGRLSMPQNPMFFVYEPDVMGMDDFVHYHTPERVILDIEPGAEEKAIKYLRKLKQEVLGTDELLYEWVSDQKAQLYEEDRRTARIFFTFSFLAIAVTCLGVLGLMMFDVRRRYREIALRKVHGARFRDIALLLSRRYLIVLAAAAAVSIPVSLIGLHKLITRYYTIHATIAWWIPFVSLLIVFLLSALTLWYQIWRATRIEPSVVMKIE